MPATTRHLATFYLGYFGLLGVLLPYLSLYFLDIGLSPYQIGIIAAITPMVKTIAPSFWGALADRSGRRRPLMRVACVGALVAFSLMLAGTSFWWIAGVMLIYSVFTSSILPLVEATAMEAVDRLGVDYGRIRLWGSVGFILATLALGPVLDVLPSSVVLWIILTLLAFNLWSVWKLPDDRADRSAEPTPEGSGVYALLTSGPVLLFYGICMLMQASHGAYYGFYSVYLEGLDFSRATIGALWALGAGVEVLLLMRSGPLLAALGTRRMMIIALGLTVLRWGMLATTTGLLWLVLAQLLHAATFGLFHVAAVTHTHRMVPPHLRATGQSLYSSLSFGLGLTVSMYLCGLFYEQVGAPTLFAAGAAVALVGLLMALMLKPLPTPLKPLPTPLKTPPEALKPLPDAAGDP